MIRFLALFLAIAILASCATAPEKPAAALKSEAPAVSQVADGEAAPSAGGLGQELLFEIPENASRAEAPEDGTARDAARETPPLAEMPEEDEARETVAEEPAPPAEAEGLAAEAAPEPALAAAVAPPAPIEDAFAAAAPEMPPAALPAAAAAPAETAPPGAWILGRGKLRPEKLAAFLLGQNAEADAAFVRNLADCYAQEAETEGIDSDVAFAQMCIETGFLRYGGLVTPDMNNFCGLGSLGPGIPGERFPSPQLGVRAHIQHLKAYATEKPLEGELIDPRYHLVKKGSAPTVDRLAGRWAADREYGKKIEGLLERLYAFSAETP